MVFLTKFTIDKGMPVRVDYDNDTFDYGFAKSNPYSIGGEFVVDVKIVDLRSGEEYFDIVPLDMVTATSSCECGNPFVLCHPEA